MRLRRQPQAQECILSNDLLIKKPAELRGKWREIFPSGAIYLEIGIGKGRFIAGCVERFPQNNYIGLEFREEMIMMAIGRLHGEQPSNLRYLWINAEFLSEIFAPGEVDGIYLNFSDPWPKKKHHKRRLTSANFLPIYEEILHPEGQIYYKTDNQDFYFWSLASFEEHGWNILDKNEDLPFDSNNVMTEYEERYRKKGQPIYFCCFTKPQR